MNQPLSDVPAHGGNPEQDLDRLNLDHPGSITDFSVNVAPGGPPEVLTENWSTFRSEIKKYPSKNGDAMTAYYAQVHDVPPNAVLPGNGASELLYHAINRIRPDDAALLRPSFRDYERALKAADAKIHDGGSYLDMDTETLASNLLEVAGHVDLVVLGHPNNPTGDSLSRASLRRIIRETDNTLFLLDEAFQSLSDPDAGHSMMKTAVNNERVLVLRSLTKLYAIPGLRAGAIIGSPGTVSKLRSAHPPWTVNRIAEEAVRHLISCGRYRNNVRNTIQQEKSKMVTWINEHGSYRLMSPSQTNFLLVRWKATNNLNDLLRGLLQNGLYVRDARNFRGIQRPCFRMALLEPNQNRELRNTLEEIAGRFNNSEVEE